MPEGMPLQKIINKLCEEINRLEADFIQQRKEISASSLGHYPGLRDYIDAIGYMMSGSLFWSYLTTRYHGPGYIWTGNTSGTVTLFSDHVEF
jgi:hypothetical protein